MPKASWMRTRPGSGSLTRAGRTDSARAGRSAPHGVVAGLSRLICHSSSCMTSTLLAGEALEDALAARGHAGRLIASNVAARGSALARPVFPPHALVAARRADG